MKETISYYIENNSCIYAAYLDNEKAFNGVWITGLLYKLFNIGVRGRYWRIIKSSYQDIVSSVFFNGVYSESYQIKQGVFQGRTLSSWMFLAMINDLIPELISLGKGAVVNDSHIPCILIADDTSLISPTLSGLRAMLDTVGEYASKWRLKYNASKSCFMIFSVKKHRYGNKSFNISLNGTALERVFNVKYAGIDIDCNLHIRNAVSSRCKKGLTVVNSLAPVGFTSSGMSPSHAIKIWEKVVIPIILYGSELWSEMTKQSICELEITQRYAARRIQGLDRRSS
ncbi:hypothetical protein SNE40_016029 [Patella caerulea]|uniref:Reverse transcriptase domain-containing protein n=1 Tax=Patella caerulea TaxID=87958 RepID=A0AAN8JA56_PATCE